MKNQMIDKTKHCIKEFLKGMSFVTRDDLSKEKGLSKNTAFKQANASHNSSNEGTGDRNSSSAVAMASEKHHHTKARKHKNKPKAN